jgi:peptidoglycan/LPS O-acetylase OafA/YrhL
MKSTTLEKKKIFNPELEILRGVAAIIVVLAHIVYKGKYFNNGYIPSAIKYLVLPAHFSVMVFFVLSGYVIGINHKDRLADEKVTDYLRKRFVRIYPIYFVATALALLVATVSYDLPTIFANFTITQNMWYPVISENSPAWTLNFEVIFYALFIPISFYQLKPTIAIIISLLIAVISLYVPVVHVITAYATGFCFWLAGLYLSRNTSEPTPGIRLIPVLLFMVAVGIIIGERDYIIPLNLPNFPPHLTIYWRQKIQAFDDLLLLPLAFLIVVLFSGHKFSRIKIYLILVQIIPIYVICIHKKEPEDPDFYLGIGLYVLAGLALFIKIPEGGLRKIGAWLGSISYGIYIIHYPILILFGQSIFITDNLGFYIIKVFLYITVVLIVAYQLEKVYQPIFKRLLPVQKKN